MPATTYISGATAIVVKPGKSHSAAWAAVNAAAKS